MIVCFRQFNQLFRYGWFGKKQFFSWNCFVFKFFLQVFHSRRWHIGSCRRLHKVLTRNKRNKISQKAFLIAIKVAIWKVWTTLGGNRLQQLAWHIAPSLQGKAKSVGSKCSDIIFATVVFLLLLLLLLLLMVESISKQKVVVSGNHELSLDPTTWEEAADYMDQAGDPRQSPQQAIQKYRWDHIDQ